MEKSSFNSNFLSIPSNDLVLFEKPRLHKNSVMLSFEHCYKLGKIYNEIVGIENISHFSINISDENNNLYILSYNPQIAFNIFKNGTYAFNGSISPTFYKKLDLYTWDETYHPSYKNILINNMERKNNINKGIVLTKKKGDHFLLYSFATKKSGQDFEEDIKERKEYFYSMGDHCFNMLSSITETIFDECIISCKKKDKYLSKSNIIQFADYV